MALWRGISDSTLPKAETTLEARGADLDVERRRAEMRLSSRDFWSEDLDLEASDLELTVSACLQKEAISGFHKAGGRTHCKGEICFSSRTRDLKIIDVEKTSANFHCSEFDHQLFRIDRPSSLYKFLSGTLEDNQSPEGKFGFPLGQVRPPAFQDQQGLLSLPPVHQ